MGKNKKIDSEGVYGRDEEKIRGRKKGKIISSEEAEIEGMKKGRSKKCKEHKYEEKAGEMIRFNGINWRGNRLWHCFKCNQTIEEGIDE